MGERLGCTPALVAEITAAANKGVISEKEKEAFGDSGETCSGEAAFVDVSRITNVRGMPTLRVDGPFG